MTKILKDKEVLKSAMVFLLFITFSIILYFPVLRSAPLWDDWFYIFKSWTLKNISWWQYWSWGQYRRSWPLFYTSLTFFKALYGENVLFYHLTSLILHSANSFLIFRFIKKIGGKYSVLLALLYLVHPLNFYSVAWIIQIKSLLAIFFFLLSLDFFFSEYNKKNYMLSLVFFTCSLLSKSTVSPIILLLPFYKSKKKILPFMFICLYSIILTTWHNGVDQVFKQTSAPMNMPVNAASFQRAIPKGVIQPRPVAPRKENYISPLGGVALSFKNLAKYSAFVLFPWTTVLVQPNTYLRDGFLDLILSSVVINLFVMLIYYFYKNKNILGLTGIFFYLVTILPLSGVISIPIFQFSNFVDYWLSLPILGIILVISSFREKRFLQGVLVGFVILFSIRTFFVSKNTSEPVSMITKAIEKNPDNALVKLMLAKHYFYTKKYELSNLILVNAKKDKRLDSAKLDQEIEMNMKGIRGEQVEESTL